MAELLNGWENEGRLLQKSSLAKHADFSPNNSTI
jgi:hypothetical protein